MRFVGPVLRNETIDVRQFSLIAEKGEQSHPLPSAEGAPLRRELAFRGF
jgi:hypothetical protein